MPGHRVQIERWQKCSGCEVGVHHWETQGVKPSLDKNLHSVVCMDWLVSEGALRMALYLVQAWNHYLTPVGADVLVQIEPFPLFGPELENKGSNLRVLPFRKRPLQNNACRALISW